MVELRYMEDSLILLITISQLEKYNLTLTINSYSL